MGEGVWLIQLGQGCVSDNWSLLSTKLPRGAKSCFLSRLTLVLSYLLWNSYSQDWHVQKTVIKRNVGSQNKVVPHKQQENTQRRFSLWVYGFSLFVIVVIASFIQVLSSVLALFLFFNIRIIDGALMVHTMLTIHTLWWQSTDLRMTETHSHTHAHNCTGA